MLLLLQNGAQKTMCSICQLLDTEFHTLSRSQLVQDTVIKQVATSKSWQSVML